MSRRRHCNRRSPPILRRLSSSKTRLPPAPAMRRRFGPLDLWSSRWLHLGTMPAHARFPWRFWRGRKQLQAHIHRLIILRHGGGMSRCGRPAWRMCSCFWNSTMQQFTAELKKLCINPSYNTVCVVPTHYHLLYKASMHTITRHDSSAGAQSGS